MNSTVIVKLMTNLIKKKFYDTKRSNRKAGRLLCDESHLRGRIRNTYIAGRRNLRRTERRGSIMGYVFAFVAGTLFGVVVMRLVQINKER